MAIKLQLDGSGEASQGGGEEPDEALQGVRVADVERLVRVRQVAREELVVGLGEHRVVVVTQLTFGGDSGHFVVHGGADQLLGVDGVGVGHVLRKLVEVDVEVVEGEAVR